MYADKNSYLNNNNFNQEENLDPVYYLWPNSYDIIENNQKYT